jgi:hypothetical protein
MSNIKDFLIKNRIILRSSEIDLEEAISSGKEVYYDGVLCAYYVEDGFNSYSAYCKASRGNFSNAFRVSNVVSFLNPDISTEILFEYMDLVCKEFFDTDTFSVDRTVILKNIKKVKDGLYNVSPSISKYFWVKPYNNIGLEDKVIDGIEYAGKGKIVMNQYNKTRKIETINKIQNAVDILTSDVNDKFITMNDIAITSGLSRAAIDKNFHLFKSEIDIYNKNIFDTDNYNTFVMNCNIYKITHTIRELKESIDLKLTKRKVAKKSELHINTVYNLWLEDDVQEALEEYNKWVKQFKK